MKKCFIYLSVITLFFSINATHAHATSGVLDQTASAVTQCTRTNSTNFLGISDGVYTQNLSGSCVLQFNAGTIPAGATINSVVIKDWHTGDIHGLFWDATSAGIDSCSISDPNWPQSGVNAGTPTIATINQPGCSSFTASNFNSIHYWRVNSFFGTAWAGDAFEEQANWTYNASISISSLVASAGSASATFNISGDTTFTQSGEVCKVNLYEEDVNTKNILTQSFATVILDASKPRTSTLAQGNIYYGFGFTSSNSTWEADGIIAPYFSAKSVQIMAQVNCSHQTINADGSLSTPILDVANQGLDSSLEGSYQWDTALIATPSALQNAPAVFQGSCSSTDWICDFKQWLYSFVCDSFCPNTQLDTQELTLLQQTTNSKIPFGYINAALSIDTSNSASSEAVPGLTVKLADIPGIPAIHMASLSGMTVTTTDSGSRIQTFLHTWVRPTVTLLIYLTLIIYLWGLTDRLAI